MKARGMFLAALLGAACIGSLSSASLARDRNHDGDDRGASAATIAARQKFFGAENVDAETGAVNRDRVIFSWITNAGYAASFRGRVVLLDTYINRFEVPPASGPDLRRTPFGAQDLVDLHPEAIFLGHGHGDHADNAAFVAKWLNIPIYSTPETCDVMQQDVARMAADPNTVNGGAKLVPDANPVNCVGVVPRGSVPGTSVVNIDQLNPVACIVAFKHIHSTTVPTDPNFWGANPVVPVINDFDPREQALYPPGTCVAPFNPGTSHEPAGTAAQIGAGATGGVLATGVKGLQGCLGFGPPISTPAPGQMNLTTTGFGGVAGPYSIFYQFILRDGHHFTTVWHNTAGPLIEGFGTDPGLTSPAAGSPFNAGVSPKGNPLVGANLIKIIESLPPTDIEFGSVTTLGLATNAVRDPFLYTQFVRPQIYVPGHMTDVQLVSSSLQSKKAFILTEDAAEGSSEIPGGVVYRPELRWLVDPNDLARPMVFDPDDSRWFNKAKDERIEQLCGLGH
ncbi:MAG TPA: MBL fold metallo-hydrolase [Stellaceae bacterium]|nr:MBL fold metallo-hydrolase [Stellaceae bacterium]